MLTAALGCNRGDPPREEKAPVQHPAPSVEWEHKGPVHTMRLNQVGYVEFSCCPSGMLLGTLSLPRNTKITVGDTPFTEDNSVMRRDAPVAKYFGQVDLASLAASETNAQIVGKAKIPISVEAPYYGAVSTSLEADLTVAGPIAAIITGAAKGPVLFESEPSDATPPDAALVLWQDEYYSVFRTEKAKVLADVDWVATLEWVDTGKKRPCGGYSSNGGPATRTLDFEVYDVRVDVFDRRKGTKVASKTFAAEPGCPSVLNLEHGEKPTVGPRREPMKKWIEDGVKAGALR
ncbi:MAG: hypothetical protein HOW73_45705 [Polyangiaceae bacterium]|nr:hypothetical protein [Polyangiaceae bacterium]